MANPDWGSVDWRLARVTPAHYEDGVYMMAETNRWNLRNDMYVILTCLCADRHHVN